MDPTYRLAFARVSLRGRTLENVKTKIEAGYISSESAALSHGCLNLNLSVAPEFVFGSFHRVNRGRDGITGALERA